ncbi:MAG TPA: ImmA/IrrE family metallo-endopeptidase [Acidimicrobiia bacterium]|nr:ImmA/IrrE family metallo-endopeptidase [Acidimicrobiia bacterium]
MTEFPTRLRRLRLMRRWDQADLARRIGFSAALISQIERGRAAPTDEQVRKIADAFGYSVDFLTNELGLSETTRPMLRAYSDASKRESDARVAACITAVEYIRLLGLKALPDLTPSYASTDADNDQDLQDIANELRDLASIETGDVVSNMIRAAERLGCIVLPFPSELGRHWGLSLRSDGLPVICVANSESVPGDRQRFTVAHELAHLALHSHLPPPRDRTESNTLERQANRVAAAFLTPADALVEHLEQEGGRITLNTLLQIKSVWGVSVKSLVGRFKELGRLDSDQARSLYKQISSRGWNKAEPVSVGLEEARWLSRSLTQKTGEAHLSAATAMSARAIGGNPADLHGYAAWEMPQIAEVIPLRRGGESKGERLAQPE